MLELRDGAVRSFTVDPVELGLAPAIPDELVGGTPDVNAAVVRHVLGGERGAHRDIVVLNAAAGLVVADAASALSTGIDMAMQSIESGAAARVLDRLVAISNDR